MWQKVLAALQSQVLALLVTAALIAIPFFSSWWYRQKAFVRVSPLVKDLLRPPGYSLSQRIRQVEEELIAHLALMLAYPGIISTFCLAQIVFARVEMRLWMIACPLVATVTSCIVLASRASKKARHRRELEIALDGEMFVGEELNQLMRQGCRVFHDIPYPYGNIDHVVVSKSGVYAVDTKTLGKPRIGDDKASVSVNYQTGRIVFPDREVTIETKQAESQTRWLSATLSAAAAVKVEAEAMLALPGWFIKERVGDRGAFPFVLNPANAVRFFVRSADRYSNEQITAIAHQLDQLCRDVKPNEKPEEPRWED